MALFIHPDNQEVLWKIINTNPYVNQMFANQPPYRKSEWFKMIIEKIYNQIPNKNISQLELHEINKETLSYMVKFTQNTMTNENSPPQHHYNLPQTQTQIQQVQQQPQQNTLPYAPQPQGAYANTLYSTQLQPISMQNNSNNKDEIFAQQVAKAERDYKSMLEKKEPPTVDFTEKFEDGAIMNMEELIEKHKREREIEMTKYASTTLVMPPTNIVSNPVPAIQQSEQQQQQQQMLPQQQQQQQMLPPPPQQQQMLQIMPPQQPQDSTHQNENITTTIKQQTITDMEYLRKEVTELKEMIYLIKDQTKQLLDSFSNFTLEE
jgi:hypothetical protein